MRKVLRAGLIGCGSLSQRGVLPHLSLPDVSDKLQLAAVVDVDEERARQSAARFNVPAYFTSIEEMLDRVDVDLVLVITPIPFHYQNAMLAMKKGKHVYIQKAMATTLAEANDLLQMRDQMGVKLAAAPGYELFPTTRQMREVVSSGRLGRVNIAYTYTMGFGHEYEPLRGGQGVLEAIDPGWYYRPGGGPLPDVTIYSLQLITSILGPVRQVTSLANKTASERNWKGKKIPVEINDNSLVIMEFNSGALAVATGSNSRASMRVPWGGLELYGTAGVMAVTEVDNASGYPLRFEVQGKEVHTYGSELGHQPYLRGEHLKIEEPHVFVDIMDLVDAIREDRAPLATGEQARHVVEIIERSYAAAKSGATQQLTSTFL